MLKIWGRMHGSVTAAGLCLTPSCCATQGGGGGARGSRRALLPSVMLPLRIHHTRTHARTHVRTHARTPPVRAPGDDREVDVYRLVQALHKQGLRTPVLLRFLDILGDRIVRLNVSDLGMRDL